MEHNINEPIIYVVYNSKKQISLENDIRNVDLSESTQVVCIGKKTLEKSVIDTESFIQKKPIYNGVITDVFKSISVKNNNTIYEIYAITNLVLASSILTQKPKDLDYERIILAIKENACDEEYNLDKLCKHVFMSRRKVQYVLKEHDTSFLVELNNCRLDNLNTILLTTKNVKIDKAAITAGFKNASSANRLLKKRTGSSISAMYKNLL
ncbi:AraC family transcriptional regulator [Vibrio sp. B172a]|uniref:helix-turn-helix domain-containing protein n=1 Tax=Vibrio sp. B172a TaxID=2835790 RepID=UPI0025568C64|nr:helix-turn-helix domain-containing protein [Vibrio sp. B172a]MDK9782324.1 AraC family transcriptional regulator [Vibrio sp. B172a]